MGALRAGGAEIPLDIAPPRTYDNAAKPGKQGHARHNRDHDQTTGAKAPTLTDASRL